MLSKLESSRVIAYTLPVLMAVLIFVLAGCRKETSGPGQRIASGISGAESGTQQTGDSVPANDTADKLDELSDKDAELAAKLEEERKAREAADATLQADIDALKTRLDALEKKLDDEVARLDAKDKELEDRLKAVAEEAAEARQALKDYLEQNFVTKTEFDALKTTVTTLSQVVAELSAKVDLNEAAIAGNTEKIAENAAKISDVLSRLDSLENRVEDTEQGLASLEDAFAQLRQEFDPELFKKLIRKLNRRVNQQFALIAGLILHARKTNRDIAALGRELDTLKEGVEAINGIQVQFAADLLDLAKEQSDLADALAEEQQAREDLQAKVAALTLDLEAYAARLTAVEQLAQANASGLVNAHQAIADARADFGKELDALEERTKKRLQKVRQYAEKLVAGLGAQVQAEFVVINGRLADLEQRSNLLTELIVRLFIEVIRDDLELRDLLKAIIPFNRTVITDLRNMTMGALNVENAFIDAIDPVLNIKGVNNEQLNADFKTGVKGACGGSFGPDGLFHSVAQREWFFHLGRMYVQGLVYGMRSDETSDMYFGIDAVVDPATLAGLLAMGVIPSYAQGTSPDCRVAVEAFAKEQLFGDSEGSKALRTALATSQALKGAAVDYLARLDTLKQSTSGFTTVLHRFLKKYLGNDAAVLAFLTKRIGGGPSVLEQLASILLEQVEDAIHLAEIKNNRERFIGLAQEIATHKNQLEQFANDLEVLNVTVQALAESVESIRTELAGLTESQIQAFNLIAAIAGRLGFTDLVELARAEAEALGGTIDDSLQNIPATCMATQHFYNHATEKSLPVARCVSSMSTPGSILDDLELTRCAIHGGFDWNRDGEIEAYTWGNDKAVLGGGWSASGMLDGHKVANGLLIRPYEPTEAFAMTLAAREKGGAYPEDGESTFVLRIFGRAKSFKIDVASVKKADFHPYSVTVEAKDYQVGAGPGGIVYEVPIPKAIGKLGACRWDREITVTALDNADAAQGSVCKHRFHTFSPLVLDFVKRDMIETINPLRSTARFDLDANGIIERTGWVEKSSAILAYDRNGNGKIDDGSELFGEATRLRDGSRAAHGFAALAEIDSDGDGWVTAADRDFSKLLLWFDLNQNGISESYELKDLASANVAKIQVTYATLPDEQAIQSHGLPEANLVKYQARFFGPSHCGKDGCFIYDVFFGASEDFVLKAK